MPREIEKPLQIRMMLLFAFLLRFGLGFKVCFDPRWPRGPEISFSLVHSGNNSDSLGIVGIAIPAGLFSFTPPMGNFGWERLGRDENCPWQTIRTNPPTHTLKQEWPHEHILICSQGSLKFSCHSITLWSLDICWFLWLTDLGQDKLESEDMIPHFKI